MVNVANPPELPREFLSQLDPKLAGLYSQLNSELASRICSLVKQALPQRIRPDRVLKFAFLYAMAERVVRNAARSSAASREHTRRAKLELAGEIHGLKTGYRNDAEAKQRYRQGRQARQQIKASIDAVATQWRVLEQVVHKRRSELPVHLQSRFSNARLSEVGKALQHMGIAVVLDEDDLTIEHGREGQRSEIAQAYIWWRLKLATYRGQWNDMHVLAFAWHMSATESITSFRTMVMRFCKNASRTHRFEKSWESVLSEKV